MIRLGAIRHSGNLHMTDKIKIGFDPADQIALHDLDMITIKHQFDIAKPNPFNCGNASFDRCKMVIGNITLIYRFDQNRHIMARCSRTSIGKRSAISRFSRNIAIGSPRHHMNRSGANQSGIINSLVNIVPRFIFAPNAGSKAKIASIDIAAPRIQPQHRQFCRCQRRRNLG